MKVGLFFGSFNPIHIGHTAIANYIIEFSDLDKIWFVVSPQNPLKNKASLLSDYQRLEMVNLAIKDDLRFKACDIELKLPKPSYTINTLTYLKEKYPSYEFVLIIGSDNYINLHKWKNYEILTSEYSFIVYPRPGFGCESHNLNGKFTIINAPQIEISSSFIRSAIASKKDIRYFLNPDVYKYISEMNFYR
ncbi:MAG: nicotinate-nucleotide adenylyltransferase [Prolixibacteraceae bacterium]|nr:nicotinate-nucleotide adenylyltransferase [Prolixibacteraceae bacterium]